MIFTDFIIYLINKISLIKEHFMDNKNRKTIIEIIKTYQDKPGSLIPILQDVQNSLGYVSTDSIEEIAANTNYSESDIYGVATFYSQFKLEKPGLHNIKLCQGTACHVIGADTILDVILEELKLKDYGTTEDGKFTLEEVACLGCCSLAPVIMIDSEVYGKLTPDKIRTILKSF